LNGDNDDGVGGGGDDEDVSAIRSWGDEQAHWQRRARNNNNSNNNSNSNSNGGGGGSHAADRALAFLSHIDKVAARFGAAANGDATPAHVGTLIADARAALRALWDERGRWRECSCDVHLCSLLCCSLRVRVLV
jgi:hypothetical protein